MIAVVDPETCRPVPLRFSTRTVGCSTPTTRSARSSTQHGARTFEGYYKNDDADAERVRNGWYWTGDLGYVDEAGFLYFAGRRGDWIRVDGENISALTIERVAAAPPAVVAAAVYGVPDPRSGDQVMAALEVADPGGVRHRRVRRISLRAAGSGRQGRAAVAAAVDAAAGDGIQQGAQA